MTNGAIGTTEASGHGVTRTERPRRCVGLHRRGPSSIVGDSGEGERSTVRRSAASTAAAAAVTVKGRRAFPVRGSERGRHQLLVGGEEGASLCGHSAERENVRAASDFKRYILARAAVTRERKYMVIGDNGRENRYKEIVLLLGDRVAGRS